MRILAIETTEAIGTLAAMLDGNLLAELKLDSRQRSAQSFAPGLKSLLEQVAWRPGDVNLVAVTTGPGSFTGLRVGVTAAKTFAFAIGADILGVDTLETIAAGAPTHVDTLWAAVDAQRGEVVAQAFSRQSGGWFEPIGGSELLDAEQWLRGLPMGAVVTGPVFRKLAEHVPKGVSLVAPEYWPPRAANVALLAARDYAAGRRDDLWALLPRYCRRSAAEEKWAGGQRKDEG